MRGRMGRTFGLNDQGLESRFFFNLMIGLKVLGKPNLDWDYTFPNDIKTSGIPFGVKLVEKVYLQSKFGLLRMD